MADYKLASVATSNMNNNIPSYSVETRSTTGPSGQKESYYQNTRWTTWAGYYTLVPEAKALIDIFTHWCIGDGYKADPNTTAILDHISGWGLDTFDDILENQIKVAVMAGDSYAHIIRDKDKGILINLKPLDPSTIKTVVDEYGIIIRYEQTAKNPQGENKTFTPDEILHLCWGRIADNICGTPLYESLEKIIKALAMIDDDTTTLIHRNVWPLRLVEVDLDDDAKITALTVKYENLIKNKEVLFYPKGTVKFETQGLSNNATFNPLPYREVLKNSLYQNSGIPQILLGGAAEFSESSAKISYVSFTNTMKQAQRWIITQIWNQLYLRIDLELPASIQNELISDNSKDGANQQMGFQPSDFKAGVGK